ncbi:MAG TPA: cupin domain-containing protein [Bacteroidales bacterium]|nr:cupin domain-containing protein [Bacteroidales bacterium]
MINRFFQEGEKLDVAGLNRIIVLLDRSETELTEIGLNEWRSGLTGPPHKHDLKEQVFYITSGVGIIKLGDQSFEAKRGSLAYIPAGVVHQSITTGNEPLCYMLFNVFSDSSKEGHASFADHIEKVKETRKQQAESVKADTADSPVTFEIKPGNFFNDVHELENKVSDSVSKEYLLKSSETNRCEMELVTLHDEIEIPAISHKTKEQSFFVTHGKGRITIDDEMEDIKPGDLLFIPRNSAYSVKAVGNELVYLCLSAIV